MKGKNSSFKIIVILTSVIFALIIALIVLNNNSSDSSKGETFDKQPNIEGQPILGEADAPVTVVEFGDFKCPSCKSWGETIFPQLEKDFINSGKVKFSYINVLFHGEESRLGSLAAESVYKQNPDIYWDFHQALFNEQPNEDHDSLWITEEKITEIANTIPNIDAEKLKSDIELQSELEELNKDTELAEEFQVKFTPSIMVNGTMLEDPFDYEAIKNLIEKELEEK